MNDIVAAGNSLIVDTTWFYNHINVLRRLSGWNALAHDNMRAPLNVKFMMLAGRWQSFDAEKLQLTHAEIDILVVAVVELFNVDISSDVKTRQSLHTPLGDVLLHTSPGEVLLHTPPESMAAKPSLSPPESMADKPSLSPPELMADKPSLSPPKSMADKPSLSRNSEHESIKQSPWLLWALAVLFAMFVSLSAFILLLAAKFL